VKSTVEVLAVDIGNTRVHAAIVDTEAYTTRCECVFSLSSLSEGLDTLLAEKESDGFPATAVVSGVVHHVVTATLSRLRAAGLQVRHFSSTAVLPFEIRYDSRAALGADRCANALYACTRFKGRDVVIVSAGTAVVIDLVSGGAFVGGAILPGLQLQARALHEFTDALPLVVMASGGESSLPATSTAACISAGILSGTAGAIEHIVRGYTASLGNSQPVLLATGGDWPLLAPHLSLAFESHPHMTLVGTALYERFAK